MTSLEGFYQQMPQMAEDANIADLSEMADIIGPERLLELLETFCEPLPRGETEQ